MRPVNHTFYHIFENFYLPHSPFLGLKYSINCFRNGDTYICFQQVYYYSIDGNYTLVHSMNSISNNA